MKHKQARYRSIIDGLKDIYGKKIRPVEEHYRFPTFYSPHLSEADLEAKPMILLLGQYSTGKTSLIRKLLNSPYPGSHIGPEPTTDKFVAVMGGEDDRIVPGNAAASQLDKPFQTLARFGDGFLNKFQLSICSNQMLKDVSFIDTPGVLSGEKQRLGRSYDFVRVCEWFAEKSDMILLLFDAHKLDISDEFKRVLSSIRGHDEKIRVILNKADTIGPSQLVRVYGALMWSLGKIIATPEVVRVYIGSFWDEGPANSENGTLIQSETEELLADLGNLPQESTMRKVNSMLKRCRTAWVHAHILSILRDEMPLFWGKSEKQTKLINKLPEIFSRIQKSTNIPSGDLPDISRFREALVGQSFDMFPRLNSKMLGKLETAMKVDLPKLMQDFPQGPVIMKPIPNPFGPVEMTDADDREEPVSWEVTADDMARYERTFYAATAGKDIKLSGAAIRTIVKGIEVSDSDLARIWAVADTDADGALDLGQFVIFMKLLEKRVAGIPVPHNLPVSLG